jgi:hypothetical protein
MAHHLEALGKNPSAEKLPAFRSQLDNHWVDVTALTSGNRPLPQTVYTHFTLLLHRYIDFLEAHTYDAPFLFHAKKLRSFAKILYTGRFALLFKAMNLEFQPNMKRKSDEDYLRALDELCSSETAPAKSVHPTILGTEMPCENA